MKQLIINADDYGLAAGVNRAIMELLNARVISSTSVVTNLADVAELAALRAVVRDVGAGVGVHINLSQGPALTGQSSMTDASGEFLSRKELMDRALRGKLRICDIRQEIVAQVGRLLQNGVVPSHFDSHQHVSAIPAVFVAMVDLARRYRVALRPQRHYLLAATGWSSPRHRRRSHVRVIARVLDANARLFGVKMARFVVEVDAVGWKSSEEGWRTAITGLPAGVNEIFVHPGYCDKRLDSLSRYGAEREQELRILKRVVGRIVREAGVRVVSHRVAFGDR
jgi:predicted glycoside hydrolase/deacetylase ChbG (UPF0249 family)